MKRSSIQIVREATQQFFLQDEFHAVVGAGVFAVPLLSVTGTVLVLDQQVQITEVTALTNLTDVWSDLWDGTTSQPITNGAPGGAVMSNLPVGSLISKTEDTSQAFTVINATTCVVNEPSGPKLGSPFTVTQKSETDTFIRIRGNAGAPVDFKMRVKFAWSPIDGGYLSVVF